MMPQHQSIPRIVHQTWKTDDIPIEWRALAQSWRTILPEWEYRLWTDRDNRNLVAEHYPWFLGIFDAFPKNIMRADAARYLILHRYGGVYADLDYECLRRFDDLLAGRELVLGFEPSCHVSAWFRERGIDQIVGNAFLASIAGHPLWLRMVRATGTTPFSEPVEATGPLLLTRMLQRHPACSGVLPSRFVYPLGKEECWQAVGNLSSLRARIPPEALGVHYWDGTWWRSQFELRGSLGAEVP